MPLSSFLAERSPEERKQEEEEIFSSGLAERSQSRFSLSLSRYFLTVGRSVYPARARRSGLRTSVVRRQKDNSAEEKTTTSHTRSRDETP